ncbi:MAG: hypothetical protein ACOC44_15270 [Promethearchaeia archaeon]
MQSQKNNQEFYRFLKDKQLRNIQRFNKISLSLSIMGVILICVIYIASTYLQFIVIDPVGFSFDYYKWLEMIAFSSVLSWIVIISQSFNLLLYYFQISFTIKPRLEILKERKNFDKKKQAKETGEAYKKTISLQVIFAFLIILTSVIWLNYYPRNAQLFYPFIGCDADTGICLITAEAFYPFIFIMTGFLIVFILLFIILLFFNVRAIQNVHRILHPREAQKKEKMNRQELKEKARIKTMSIEERRKRKLEQLREEYRRKAREKQKEKRKKYMQMLQQEKYGKKGYKKLKEKKKKKVEEKKKKEKKQEKIRDRYDFT